MEKPIIALWGLNQVWSEVIIFALKTKQQKNITVGKNKLCIILIQVKVTVLVSVDPTKLCRPEH